MSFNDSLRDKNIIFIIGGFCTGKSSLAEQIENIDEIIDDGDFVWREKDELLQNEICIKLSRAKEAGKRFVVIVPNTRIMERISIMDSSIAFIFTCNAEGMFHQSLKNIPHWKIIEQNKKFREAWFNKENFRPYLFCYSKNSEVVFETWKIQERNEK